MTCKLRSFLRRASLFEGGSSQQRWFTAGVMKTLLLSSPSIPLWGRVLTATLIHGRGRFCPRGRRFGFADAFMIAPSEIDRASAHGTPLAHATAAASKTICRRAFSTYLSASFLMSPPRKILRWRRKNTSSFVKLDFKKKQSYVLIKIKVRFYRLMLQ